MTNKTLAGITAAVLLTVLCAVGGTALLAGAVAACTTTMPTATAPPIQSAPGDPPTPTSDTATGPAILPCQPTCSTASNTDSPSPMNDCLNAETVLARAATWLTAWNGGPVPYLSSTDATTWYNGYRRDCSGYTSMALGLSGPGLDAAGLAARSTPIGKNDLHPGDLLINSSPDSAGHVVIFDQWADPTMTTYIGYEQSGDGGTHHRVITYPYFNGYPMNPYRYAGLPT
jgi:hypothetical protein